MKSLAAIAFLGLAYATEDNELYGSNFLRKPIDAPLKTGPTFHNHSHHKLLQNDDSADHELHRPVFLFPKFNLTKTNKTEETHVRTDSHKIHNHTEHTNQKIADNHLYRPVFLPKFPVKNTTETRSHRPIFVPKFPVAPNTTNSTNTTHTRSHQNNVHNHHKKIADNHLYRPVFLPKFPVKNTTDTRSHRPIFVPKFPVAPNTTNSTNATKIADNHLYRPVFIPKPLVKNTTKPVNSHHTIKPKNATHTRNETKRHAQFDDEEFMQYDDFFKMAMQFKDQNMSAREHDKRPRVNGNIQFDDYELYGGGPSLKELNKEVQPHRR